MQFVLYALLCAFKPVSSRQTQDWLVEQSFIAMMRVMVRQSCVLNSRFYFDVPVVLGDRTA
jgi:hypothetical protein